MASLGVQVYLLTVIWFVTLLLCWVSLKTGHYVGKVALGLSLFVTLIVLVLPRVEIQYLFDANFYDPLLIRRYAILSILLISAVVGLTYCFVSVCLAPIETRKVRTLGSIN